MEISSGNLGVVCSAALVDKGIRLYTGPNHRCVYGTNADKLWIHAQAEAHSNRKRGDEAFMCGEAVEEQGHELRGGDPGSGPSLINQLPCVPGSYQHQQHRVIWF